MSPKGAVPSHVRDLAAFLKGDDDAELPAVAAAKKKAVSTVLKRPAAASTILKKPSAASPTLKKPAAAGTIPKPQASAITNGRELAIVADPDPESADDTNRDRNKQHHFKAKFDDLPDHVQKLWNDVASEPGARRKQTEIVNKSIQLQNGQYQIDPGNPYFQEVQQKIDKRYKVDQQHSLPRTIMAVRCGTAALLDAAVANGEIQEFDDPSTGAKFYSYREIIAGSAESVVSKKSITKGKNISSDTYKKIEDVLTGMGWSFNFTPKELKDSMLAHADPPSPSLSSPNHINPMQRDRREGKSGGYYYYYNYFHRLPY